MYLAWCDFTMDPTKEKHQQILEKVCQRPWQWLDKHLAKEAWAVQECLNSMPEKKPRQVKNKVKSMPIIFFDIKGIFFIKN
jgi:hypothetical protein